MTINLCDVCSKVDFERGLQGNWEEEIYLGPLVSVFRKQQCCCFCNLIYEALKQVNGGDVSPELAHDGEPIECILWNIFGGRSQQINGITKAERLLRIRLHGHWNKEFDGLNIYARQLATDSSESNLFLGRRINDGQISFETVKEWLRSCERWHGTNDHYRGCGLRTWETLLGKPDLLRVIDVHRKCISPVPQDCRYVALSYVWGGATTLQAKMSNIDLLSSPDGLSKASGVTPIARTVRDAIELTQKIGEEYLWVDSLCIVQDDPKDKHSQINAMDQVYGSAVLTIVASGGDHADSGLAGVRPSSRIGKQITAEVSPGISLAVPLQAHGFKLDLSTWNTRAWTYQERLLSKRFLIFSPHGVYWQCRTMIRTEDIFLESEGVFDVEMMSITDRLRFLDVDAQWSGTLLGDPSIPTNQIRLLRSPTLTQYMWAVEEYTRRELSYPQDILNAFAGIQRILDIGMRSKSWYGIPSENLDLALLWKPRQISRRRTNLSGQEDWHAHFPSWSWAGWIGPMHHSTLFPENSRHEDEERVRPLLHWYKRDTSNGLSKVSQYWESTGAPGLCLSPEPWLPLNPPPDFFKTSPKISDSMLCNGRIYFRTYTARFVLGGINHEGRKRQTKSTSVNIHDATGAWVGLAEMNVDVSPGSICEFLIVSEAQWVGLHSLDQTYRLNYDHYLYFNVLVINWVDEVANRIGIGRVKKEAWANIDPICKDIALG